MLPLPKGFPSPSIIELNKDVEPFIVQGKAVRSVAFKDTVKPLQFIHFSDVHAIQLMWERITEYMNYYSNYISFALHTGDYCGGAQEEYADCYNNCTPSFKPIYNCVGNHDTVYRAQDGKYAKSNKATVHKLLFNKIDNWEVEFMPIEHSMTFYKDFPESNIRLIVVDQYYDIEPQKQWVKERLDEALEQGIHVITACHTVTSPIVMKLDVTFQSIVEFEPIGGNRANAFLEDLLVEFKNAGGVHIAHLAGHEHHDMFGYTEKGVLNIAVECATSWNGWCDGNRARGTKTFDCFNVVSVDTVTHAIKLARVGNNADCYLRIKRTLCYDYIENKLIYNG